MQNSIYQYLENINIKDVIKISSSFNSCLLENNQNQLEDFCDFFKSSKKLLLMNGFSGVGKTELTDFILSYVKEDVFVLKYNCLENTILDDMLLSFFETFRRYTIQGKFTPPRLKVENFTQKINSYFNSISQPVIVVLNSFDMILKENKQDVLNFIKHIKNLPNVKIIITSRTYNYEDFDGIDYSTLTLLAFSKPIFEKFLKDNDIKNIGILSNELYKQTRGYYLYINMAVKIMSFRQYSMGKFFEVYSKSGMSFVDFLIREMLSIIDPVSLHLFRLLAVMRIPLNFNLLKSVHLYGEDRINFYAYNTLLYVDKESVYLPDYYREIIEKQIPDNVMIKLHRACVELYETQLPLKPLERDLKLSRQTMRNEIEYHSLFIPQKPIINSNPALVLQNQLLSVQKTKEAPQEKTINAKISEPLKEETKEEKIEKINFIIEDENLLEDIAGSIKDFVEEKVEKNEFAEKSSSLDLARLLNLAKQEEANYNYKYAVLLYQNALTKDKDDNFDKFLPTIYMKLANAYMNQSQWYEALDYLTKAQDYYENVMDEIKSAEVKLKMAEVYFIIYKQDNAKYILNELNKRANLPKDLYIKINIALGKISDNINEEYTYYNRALSLIDSHTDKSVVTELYYRFAVVNDQKDNANVAANYYKKCITLESNPQKNKYVSQALANLAELYDEAGHTDMALKYYGQSMKIDEDSKNYNGLYSTVRHLSEIYSGKDASKSLKYLNMAYSFAKKLNEPYYIVDTSYEIGNYYLIRKEFSLALKYMEEALRVATSSLPEEDAVRIVSKIDYIKKLNSKL